MINIKAISSLEKVTDNAAFCEEVLYFTVLKNEKLRNILEPYPSMSGDME